MLSILLTAAGVWAWNGHTYFVVKSEDGREEMKVSCDGGDSAGSMDCRIRVTQMVVPDVKVASQFSENARLLSQGDDSLRTKLCKELQLIQPRVNEAREIVEGLREGCAKADSRKLASAYAKMDLLSKKTCIVINSEEYLRFAKGETGAWVYEARNPDACFALKRYVIRDEGGTGGKRLEKTIEYSGSTAIACRQEHYIDKTGVLKQLTDGRVEWPDQCRYLYLE
jgi:hypothetical protein